MRYRTARGRGTDSARAAPRGTGGRAVVERLEGRCHWSATTPAPPVILSAPTVQAVGADAGLPDLTCAVVVTAVPDAVVAGEKTKITATVRVSNAGTAPATGPVTIALYVGVNHEIDGEAVAVSPVTKKWRVAPGQTKSLLIPFKSFPPVTEAGQYHVLADVDSAGAVAEADETNNVGITDTHIRVVPAYHDLQNAFALVPPAFTRGRRAVVVLDVYNTGNVTEAGTTTIQFTVQPADGSGSPTPAATLPVRLNLKPGASRRVSLRFVVPRTLVPGTQGLISTIDAGGQLAELNEANNWVGPADITVV